MFFAYLLDLNHSLIGAFKYFIARLLNSDEKSNFENFVKPEKSLKPHYKLNINKQTTVYVQTDDWIKNEEDAIVLKKEMEKLHILRTTLENDLQVERTHLGDMLNNVCAVQKVLYDARKREENYERELRITNERIIDLNNTIRTLRSPLHTVVDEIASYKIDERKFLVPDHFKLKDANIPEDSMEFKKIVFNGILSMFSTEVEEIVKKEELILNSFDKMKPNENFLRINFNSDDYKSVLQT